MPLYVNEMGHSFRENRSKILWFFNVTTMGQWWLGVCGAPSGQRLVENVLPNVGIFGSVCNSSSTPGEACPETRYSTAAQRKHHSGGFCGLFTLSLFMSFAYSFIPIHSSPIQSLFFLIHSFCVNKCFAI